MSIVCNIKSWKLNEKNYPVSVYELEFYVCNKLFYKILYNAH